MGRTALIAGGGIGGLSAAVGLNRTGWRVTVLEQAPEITAAGAGITLMANALRGLDALGVGDAVRAAGGVDAPGGTRTSTGSWISRIDSGELTRRLGTAVLGIHRATLHRILLDALPAGTVVTGTRVLNVDAEAGQVRYACDDRQQVAQADLVVGADGINSVLRTRLWPEVPEPVYSGSTAWRGVTRDRWTGELTVAISWAPGAEFGIVPLRDGRIYWYAAVNAPAGGREADEMAAVRGRFAGWHAPIGEILDATDRHAVLRNDIYRLATPLPSYIRGRVALLGDAAHAMTPNLGQGGCQAIEDAVVLAACCATADLPAGLAAYDRQRRPRTQQIAKAAWRIGRYGQQLSNPVAVALRNMMMRLTPPQVALKSMARYADWQPPVLPGGEASASARLE